MIVMRHDNNDAQTITHFPQQLEQGDRIRTAADRHGHAIAGVEKLFGMESR